MLKAHLISKIGYSVFGKILTVSQNLLFYSLTSVARIHIDRRILPFKSGNEKKGFTQKWKRHMSFCTWGIQTGPFAACLADFVTKVNKTQGFLYVGIQTEPVAAC